VCWQLFASFGSQKSLRGSHSTMYPVELPIWVPEGVVEEMRERFLIHLRDEISIMLKGAEQRRSALVWTPSRRHASHESESNISVASSHLQSTMDLENND